MSDLINLRQHASEVELRHIDAVIECGSIRAAARETGAARSSIQAAINRVRARSTETEPAYTLPDPVDPELSYDELKEYRKKVFAKKAAAKRASRWVPIKFHRAEPTAIVVVGDPHVDDDGCNWPQLERDTETIVKTPGMFAGSIGDNINNWVGRLSRLYANQSTTENQAWRLSEGWIRELADPGKLIFMVRGNHDCLDLETEALTRRGWLRHDELKEDDLVFGLDAESGRGEWQPILGFVKKRADRINRVSLQGIDWAVTDGHRILHQKRKWKRDGWKDLDYCQASELTRGRVRIPVAAESGPGVDLSEPLIRLAAWFHTDGGYESSSRSYVRFYQSKDPAKLVSLLDACSVSYTEAVRSRAVEKVCGRKLVKEPLPQRVFRVSAESSAYLAEIFGEKGRLPRWVLDLNQYQFEAFLDSFIDGDGSRYAHTDALIAYGTKEVLSDLQAACHVHGKRATLTQDNRGSWRLNICSIRTVEFDGSKQWAEETNEEVWCLNVPLTNFMVRRGGKAYFTGNCWSGSGDPLNWIMRGANAVDQEWQAQMQFEWPGAKPVRMWAAHDFKGHSQYNPLHAQKKKHIFHGGQADIYIAGHRHHWALSEEEDEAGKVVHFGRARGYKFIDSYSDVLGHAGQDYGASIAYVIDPTADGVTRIRPFPCVQQAAEFLMFLRSR